MSKIIRTKSNAHGGITDAEREAMKKHSDLWISRALRTDPIEPKKIIPAIEGLYKTAGLKKPRVVIVPSPIVMAMAFGASAAIWYRRKKVGTDAATDAATSHATAAATDDATADATDRATYDATYAATRAATYDATSRATDAATDAATSRATAAATDAATSRATAAATDAATDAATYDATRAATDAATSRATDAATSRATNAAADAATYDATRAATYDATRAATYAATRAATYDATDAATDAAFKACEDLAGNLGIKCANKWSRCYQGGNMWSGYESYLTACRDILGLELKEHEGYKYWEQAAIHGGFRVMHEEFCMVCNFPEFIKMDENNLPHCENGPSHKWRDGWSLYHWHGVRVPCHWIESPETVDPIEVLKTDNVEERAAGVAILGMERLLDKLKHEIVDSDEDPERGDLIKVQLPDLPEPGYYLRAYCPRNGRIMEAVNANELDELTVRGAQAWRLGITAKDFIYPEKRT